MIVPFPITRHIPMQNLNQSALELIGSTPIIRVQNIDTGPCELYLKLENQNPGGSIKDRIALSMIDAAEKAGAIQPGDTLIEATAGNTGLALALVANQKGYKLTLVVPDKMSQEKIFHLKALGAHVVLTRSDVYSGHPEYYHAVAKRIAETTPRAFYINQFDNQANPDAHYKTTAPEIWEQMLYSVDAIVVGVGTGGTLTGIGKYFAEVSPDTEMVLADPEGSILVPYLETGKLTEAGKWIAEGIGEDFIPATCDLSYVRKAYAISDIEGVQACHDILRLEGILSGSSSGTLIAAALKYCREQTTSKRVITFVCDSGNKYLSKIYNNDWLAKQGLEIQGLS